MQALATILTALFVVGVTHVRLNMYRSARYRSSAWQQNLTLHSIHLLAGLLLVVGFAAGFIAGHLVASVMTGLGGLAYDLSLRWLCIRRETRRLRQTKPNLTAAEAHQRVLRRGDLAYQAAVHHRPSTIGLTTTTDLRLPTQASERRDKTPAPQPKPASATT